MTLPSTRKHQVYPVPQIIPKTGFSLPKVPEEGYDKHSRNFRGVPGILGPKWAQLPTITVGLLGVQMISDVEIISGVWRKYVNNVFS
jgi:hypothetical protein